MVLTTLLGGLGSEPVPDIVRAYTRAMLLEETLRVGEDLEWCEATFIGPSALTEQRPSSSQSRGKVYDQRRHDQRLLHVLEVPSGRAVRHLGPKLVLWSNYDNRWCGILLTPSAMLSFFTKGRPRFQTYWCNTAMDRGWEVHRAATRTKCHGWVVNRRAEYFRIGPTSIPRR